MPNRMWSMALVCALALAAAGCAPADTARPVSARKVPAGASPSPSPSKSEGPVADDFVGVLNDHYTAQLDSVGAPKGAAFDPAAASIRGPHYAAALAESVAVPELSAMVATRIAAESGARSALRPNPGHELLLVRFAKPPLAPTERGSGGTQEVVVGDQRRPLPKVVTDGTVLAISVPQGAPASLQITEDGRAQSIDLRTGAAGRVEGLYPQYGGYVDKIGSWFTPAGSDMIPLGIGLDFTLTAWAEGTGWAPPGKVWLRYEASAVLYGDGISCAIDMGRTLTLSGTGFRASGAGTFTVDSFTTSLGGKAPPVQTGATAVPANLRSVSVGWSLHATCTRSGAPVKFSIRSNNGGTATLKPEKN